MSEAEARQREERQAAIAAAGMIDNWKGQVELGASRSTGRTSYLGLFGSVGLDREGIEWRHKVQARAELQEGRNVDDWERLLASWQPNYKLGERLYAYGLTQFESDSKQGYDGRYTAGGGLGYGVLRGDKARLDVEGGPALRHIDPMKGSAYSTVAARASVNLRWAVAPTLELKQASALYLEEGDTNANFLTTLDARLLGPLKARLSYDVRYEDSIRSKGSNLDTLSRATLVYSF